MKKLKIPTPNVYFGEGAFFRKYLLILEPNYKSVVDADSFKRTAEFADAPEGFSAREW